MHGRVPTTCCCCCRPADVVTGHGCACLQRGYDVWGCYMSPVADEYGKKGLAPVQHRLEMCRLAAAGTGNVMVDAWEGTQPGYTRTLQVGWGVGRRLVREAVLVWASCCGRLAMIKAETCEGRAPVYRTHPVATVTAERSAH